MQRTAMEVIKTKPDALGLRRAADVLGVSVTTLRRWIRDGDLKAFRAGPKLLRVTIVELNKLQKNR